jgi:photosystem II stability/assembly factor-like uncharacterized protein
VNRASTASAARLLFAAWFALAVLGAGRVAASEEPLPAEPARLASQSLLLGGATAGTRLVAVGERGHIMLSDDGGRDWRQAEVPTRATLTAVYFPAPEQGWAVGHDMTILHTADGGEHWTLQHRAPEEQRPLLSVWFRDIDNGYAIGAYGAFLVTINGGRSWAAKRMSDDDYHLNGLATLSDGTMFMAGEAGSLYMSTDEALTWYPLESPYHGSFFGILALDSDALLIYGLRGRVYRSEDRGRHWQAVETPTESSLMGGRVLPDGRAALVGLGGVLLVSNDGGRSFTLHTMPERQALSAVLPGKDGQLVLLGETGVLLTGRDVDAVQP